MAHFSPFIYLVDVALAGGFKIQGGHAGDYSGWNVSPASDVNGDGFDDFIICADGYDGTAGDRSGCAYVIFGKDTGFVPLLDLAQLTAADGFVIAGETPLDLAGRSVSAADINGDGFTDLILGAFLRDSGGLNSGGAYVVFGKSGGFGTTVNVSELDGTNGFEVQGESAGDFAGLWVSGGDINGDGFDDMIMGAPGTQNTTVGAAYVVFGKADGFDPLIDLAHLGAAEGFKLQGVDALGYAGLSVSLGGDINDDGFNDLIVGAFGSGAAYVVFGKNTSFGTTIDLGSLSAAEGFEIQGAPGDWTGFSVELGGDINGDGVADILLGATHDGGGGTNAGAAYVIFGRTSGFGSTIDLTNLAVEDGFKIQGESAYDYAGTRVSSAGDVNGDGFDDLLVGASQNSTVATNAGAAYLIFGKATGFAAVLDLRTLSPSNGFKILGEGALDYAGHAVSSAGDINGDGFDDILVGSSSNSSGGHWAGATYVIFGRPDNTAPSGTDATITVGEDDSVRVLSVADFGFTDSDGDAFLAVTITSVPAAGLLLYAGSGGSATPVNAGQSISAADIAAGKLTFAPGDDASGVNYASFTFQVQDDGGIVASGIDFDSSPNTITINVAHAPVFTSSSSFTVGENQTAAATVAVSDADIGDSQTFSISGGADAAKFEIDSSTGALTFNTAPDFESAADADADNVYEVQVKTTDSDGLFSTQSVTVTVEDVNEAPTITSLVLAAVENQSAAGLITVDDPDNGDSQTFSISGGADASAFDIDSATGALSFKVAPTVDSPTDTDSDNVYQVQIKVTDTAGLFAIQGVAVTVITSPVLTIASTLEDDNRVSASEDDTFTVSGTSSGLGVGQVIAVTMTDVGNAHTVNTNALVQADGSWSATDVDISALLNGDIKVAARVLDLAGGPTPLTTVTLDNVAPAVAINTPIAGNNVVDAVDANAGFAISGTSDAESGQIVTVDIRDSLNNLINSYADVIANGQWSVSVTIAQAKALTDGNYTVSANVTDASGNPAPTAIQALGVDETVITGITPDTGTSGSDGITSADEIILRGKGPSGHGIEISQDGMVIGSVIANAAGNWNFVVSELIEGTHSFAAEDLNNNGAATFNVTVDQTLPTLAVNVVDASLHDADDSSVVTFAFSEAPGASFTLADIVAIGGEVSALTMVDATHFTATFTATDGFSGSGSVSVIAGSYTDAAGNLGGTGAGTVSIDRLNPTLAINATLEGDDRINASEDNTFTITGTSSGLEAGRVVSVTVRDAGNVHTANTTAVVQADGSWTASDVDISVFVNGAITLTADVTDVAGNPAPQATETATLDNVSPVLTLSLDDAILTVGDTATITFSFSETPIGFAQADVQLSAGVSFVGGSFVQADATHYSAVIQPTAHFDGTSTISVAGASFADIAGNLGVGGSKFIDVHARTPSILWRNSVSFDTRDWLMENGSIAANLAIGAAPAEWKIIADGDFNADGITDLFWRSTATGELREWLMSDTGVASNIMLGGIPAGWSIVGTGDFNSDGTTDLLWRDPTGGNLRNWQMSNGVIAQNIALNNPPASWSIQATGDFNGDGVDDILWRNSDGTLRNWSMANGQFSSNTALPDLSADWRVAASGDFNANGTTDIMLHNVTTGQVREWLMGGGNIASEQVLQSRGSEWSVADAGDYNQDGNDDLVWLNANTGEVQEWSLVNGALTGTKTLGFLPQDWDQPLNAATHVNTTDIGGASPAPIVVHAQTPSIFWRNSVSFDTRDWLMENGAIAKNLGIGAAPAQWKIIADGDFNADGITDLFWRSTATGELREWLMSDTGVASNIMLGGIPAGSSIVGTGDFNGDGTTDLLWRDPTGGNLRNWQMSNGAIAQNIILNNLPASWSIQATGDFNGDGVDDILWRNSDGTLRNWSMANGQFSSNTALPDLSADWRVAASGDFNANGTTDIMLHNVTTGQVREWLMGGGNIASEQVLQSRSSEWSVADAGDYNQDGTDDLVWLNANTGEVQEWSLVNGALTGTKTLGFLPQDWDQPLNAATHVGILVV